MQNRINITSDVYSPNIAYKIHQPLSLLHKYGKLAIKSKINNRRNTHSEILNECLLWALTRHPKPKFHETTLQNTNNLNPGTSKFFYPWSKALHWRLGWLV